MNNMTEASGSQEHNGYVIDAENAAEMARLTIQDDLLTQSMGFVPEQIDLTGIRKVLDVACGSGGWLLNLVARYPHLQGMGIDISQIMMEYASNLAATRNLTNVEFQVMDVTQPLQFPDNSFDLINARILTGFLSAPQWPTLLQECYRLTRPGGLLCLTEAEWGFTNSPALDTLSGFTALAFYRAGHSFSPSGRTIGTTNMFRLLLKQAGYQNIEQKAHVIDFSAGTPIHNSNVRNALTVYRLIEPFFIAMQIATPGELSRLQVQAEEEMQKADFCAIDYYTTAWGRK